MPSESVGILPHVLSDGSPMRVRHLLPLLPAALPAVLLAQQPVDSAGTDSLRRARAALETVRVTARAADAGYRTAAVRSATRTDTPLRLVPQSVSVVGRRLIRDQSMQSMADVVRYVPGITMAQGEGHRDAPVIRGQATTADFFVDGVRDDAQYLRDLYNVDRVEALKGANALAFGRGGGGGVINRAMKEATWSPVRGLVVEGGSFGHRRAALDVGQGTGRVAGRLNAMVENSGGWRDAWDLERHGVNPVGALALGANTMVRASYEHFVDRRRTDRGIPSLAGRPSAVPIRTFFGNPDSSRAVVRADVASLVVDHVVGRIALRNTARWARYDKGYTNVFPSSGVSAQGTVNLAAYRSDADRTNLFDQLDATVAFRTGPVTHRLLVGGEIGRQVTDNYRATGYFGDAATATSLAVPATAPTVAGLVTWRQSATDADNRVTANVAGAFVQDQLALGARVRAVAGVRVDRFALDFANARNGQALQRTDRMVSPRVGLIVDPWRDVSLYVSRGTSFLPASGDQFAALTASTSTLRPERFDNEEIGLKWDATSRLALTAAAYRLDRTNSTAVDPADPTRVVQTGASRAAGWELGASGDVTSWWQLAGGFTSQVARITATTSASPAGRRTPLVPRTAWSLWNRVQPHRLVGVGLGVIRQSAMFATIDNAVTLPAFTRVDAALYVRLPRDLRAQLNVENVLDERYWPTAHNNNNIMPGAPRLVRLSLTTTLP